MRRTRVAVLWVGGFLVVASGLGGCGESSRPPADPVVSVRSAVFINGDFEADAIGALPSGWTVSILQNNGLTDTRPSPQTLASLNLTAGGYTATHVVGGAAGSQTDPNLGTAGTLRIPKFGVRAAVVNFAGPSATSTAQNGGNHNVNQLTQTMTTTNADVDSADNKVHIRFAIAPVLYFTSAHGYTLQPYYYVELKNITKGTTLYTDFNVSAQPGVPWQTVPVPASTEFYYYTDWSLVDIAPGNSGLAVGDQVTLIVIAGGCGQTGHFGRVYVDGLGSTIPGIYTYATGPASANTGSNITYVVNYKNGGTATAAATTLATVIPTGTTFQSTSLPSACTGVAVGAIGTLTCSLGALGAGASGSFTVTVGITGASGTTVTNGNYSIQATGVTPLLGPKVLTAVTSGVVYSDVAVTKTDGAAAVGWGQAVTYSVVASNAGPGAATSVTIADTMPAQFTGATWTCAGTGGGTCTPTSGTGDLSGTTALPVGATVTYTIQGAIVAGTGTGSVTNTATATLAGATDPDLTNNTGVDTDSIGVLRTLTVTKTNPNGGAVTSVPASIACGTSCASATGSFVDGTSVVLSASPVSGASFTAWGGACTGSATTCTLTITSNVSVAAAFTPPPTVNLTTGNNQGAALNTAFATTLTVRVLDSAGNPLAGRTVLLTMPSTGASAALSATSVTTDAAGFTPPVTATANGTAGAYLVTAALSGTPTTETFSLWNYGAATSVNVFSGSGQSATVGAAFPLPLTVVVRDAASQPVPGVTVTFAAPGSGARATLSPLSGTTNASGQTSVSATAGTVAGGYSVTATAGAATPATFTLTNAVGAAASITATSGSPQSALISTAFAAPLVVTVRDSNNNVVPGVLVTFTVPLSGASASLSADSGTTNASGVVSVAATANGTLGAYAVTAAAAGVTTPATFSLTNFGTLALTPATTTRAPRASATFVATGDPAASYIFTLLTNASGGSINAVSGVYTAGGTGGVSDVVSVMDSMSRTATATVTVGAAVSISPNPTTSAPRGSKTFTATGGSGTGFVFALLTNASSGSIVAATGVYTAGATGGVTDVVGATDSLGNTATASIAVGAGITLAPATASTSPRGTVTLAASGGSGAGYVYTVTTNASGGSVDSTGRYTAGNTGGVTDVVTVTDSLGNTATRSITVGGAIVLVGSGATSPPRGALTFSASGGTGTGFTFAITTNLSGGTVDSAGHYTAGNIGAVADVVTVTDSLGNTQSASVVVGAAVTLVGSGAGSPPRGALTFSASGGSGIGFVYSLSANASGGTIDVGTGAYTAGSSDSVVDIVTVVDSLGNIATANVAVGVGVSLSPATPNVAPRAQITLVAIGGSGTGFAFALFTNGSGGSVDASTGVYTAGAVGATADSVSVTDSLGNAASVSISVGSGLTINPTAPGLAPREPQTFTASGGSGVGVTFAITSNRSGGTIDAVSGAYVAGPMGGTTDVVTATDSLGNTASATTSVGLGLSVTPGVASLAPLGAQGFSVSGGSGTGYRFTLSNAASGGAIDINTGAYIAGAIGGVTDAVLVTDSLGNTGSAPVTVSATLRATASTLTVPPQGSRTLTVTGGAGGNTLTLTVNGSGATVDALTGVYVAGLIGQTSDIVTVTDINGATITITVTVGPGLSLDPASPSVAPRGPLSFSATGGSGSGYQYTFRSNRSGGSINATTGAYLAGAVSNLIDVVTATDSLGNTAQVSVSVGGGLTVNPATPTLAPRATVTLTASGGSGTGYTFAVSTNLSGASIDSGAGAYQAGTVPNVTDEVKVTDSLGNFAVATIMVGPGVLVAPAASTVAPRGTVILSASGGSGTGYLFAVTTNISGATVDARTGRFVAGTIAAATDLVMVTDSLGNSAVATINLGAGLSLSAAATSTPPRGMIALAAAGGGGSFTYSVRQNGSGASIVSTSGLYTAGPTPSTTDLIEVTDEVGNSATVSITVGPGVSLTPSSPVTAPAGALAFTAAGGNGVGYTFALSTNGSGGTVDSTSGAYVAGSTSDTSDVVRVSDSLGNSASVTIAVGAGVSLNPPTSNVAPRAAVQLTAVGGSGTGYAFTLTTNASGGSIDAQTGLYHAGTVPDVTDVAKVVDSIGNAATARLTVGAGLRIVATATSVAPLGTLQISASGGGGMGYHFTITSNGSGATIDPITGDYRAGSTGPSTDVVTVTDGLGNSVNVAITVGAPLSVTAAASGAVAPRGTTQLTASGGAPGYTFVITTNHSGGSISAAEGVYTAGSTPNVQDVVTITDGNGTTRTVTISVGPGISITPADPKVAPKGPVQLVAAGGSGVGFTWLLVDNAAGGSVDAATGKYTAGGAPPTGSADVVEVTDSLGNTAHVTIHPTAAVFSASGGPGGCNCATAGGASPLAPSTLLFALLALTLVARRRSGRRPRRTEGLVEERGATCTRKA